MGLFCELLLLSVLSVSSKHLMGRQAVSVEHHCSVPSSQPHAIHNLGELLEHCACPPLAPTIAGSFLLHPCHCQCLVCKLMHGMPTGQGEKYQSQSCWFRLVRTPSWMVKVLLKHLTSSSLCRWNGVVLVLFPPQTPADLLNDLALELLPLVIPGHPPVSPW